MSDRDGALLRALEAQRGVRASDDLRMRLRSELLRAPVTFAAPQPRAFWWRRAAAALVMIAVALGGSGAAAAASLPGEPAFALKRAFEEVQVALAGDEAARAGISLEIAERRLADLWRTNARPELAGAAAAAYSDAVTRVGKHADRLRTAPAEPARDETLERVRDAGWRAVEQLEQLEETLPEPAQQGIERAIEAHEEQQHRDAGPNAPPRTPKPEKTPRPEAPGRAPASPPRR